MNPLEDLETICPCCGEPVGLQVEAGQLNTWFGEDCPVCCQPIRFRVTERPDGSLEIRAEAENLG